MADKENADMHIVIIAGGLGHEREVSLRSGVRVQNALRGFGFRVDVVDFDSHFSENIELLRPDLAFPLVHGAAGEGGSLPQILELMQIPYIGTHAAQARLASDKPSLKAVLRRAGISTPDFCTLSQSLFKLQGVEHILSALDASFGYPLVVKPALGGSALGVSIVHDDAELRQALIDAFAYCETIIVEKFVEGTELAASVVCLPSAADDDTNIVTEIMNYITEIYEGVPEEDKTDIFFESSAVPLPVVEIVPEDVYDYDARYNPGRVEFFTPARLTKSQTLNALTVAKQVHKLLDLRHLSRIDMIQDKQGELWILDVNTAPGMTDMSLLPQSAAVFGGNGSTNPNEGGFQRMLAAMVRHAINRMK